MVEDKVGNYWKNWICNEASQKNSLKYLNISNYAPKQVHPIWSSTKFDPVAVRKASVKAKLLLGVYTLQTNKAQFNQYKVKMTCPLCELDNESREHFIISCPALSNVRHYYFREIQKHLTVLLGPGGWSSLAQDQTMLVKLILDVTHLSKLIPDKNNLALNTLRLENLTRGLCYALHSERSKAIEARPP